MQGIHTPYPAYTLTKQFSQYAFEVIGNGIPSDSSIWSTVQNAVVLYPDNLVIDRFYGLVVEIDQHKLVVEVLNDSDKVLSPDEFVCNKWLINKGLYHPNLKTYGQPFALVLLERREMIEDARKESEKAGE